MAEMCDTAHVSNVHVQVGLCTVVGIQLAKPIKRRTSPAMYTYFTWCVLMYTCVKMWF